MRQFANDMNTHMHTQGPWDGGWKETWNFFFYLQWSSFPDVPAQLSSKKTAVCKMYVCYHICICVTMFYYYVCTLPGLLRNRSFLFMITAPSGQNKSVMCFKYLPDSVGVPSWKLSALAQSHWEKSLVTAESAVMLMFLIYTQEVLKSSDWLWMSHGWLRYWFLARPRLKSILFSPNIFFFSSPPGFSLTLSILHPVSCQPVPVGPIHLASP